jgi:hypothetical protein
MDKFLDAYDLPKLNKVNINWLKRNEIEAVILSQQRKAQNQT